MVAHSNFIALLILSCAILLNAGYSLISPFFPDGLRHRNLSYLYNSSIFAVFNCAAIATAFLGPRVFLSRCNRLPVIATGSFIQALTIFCMGALGSVPLAWLFLTLAHVCRLV